MIPPGHCPYPIDDDDGSARQCVARGHCGCDERLKETNMITKTFEIRDRNTFVPVLAIQLEPGNEADRYLLARAGYGLTRDDQARYVQLCRVNGGYGSSTCDPYDWGAGARTLPVAHQYLIEHFAELDSGAVVDVEFILGETDAPKVSEATSNGLPFRMHSDDE